MLVGFTVRECEMPIRENGWSVMATHRNTGGSEHFTCPKCLVTVPAEWVYKNQSLKEALELMKGWGANVHSIHNRKPLPPVTDEPPAGETQPEGAPEEEMAKQQEVA
jgi:hypothetical protein